MTDNTIHPQITRHGLNELLNLPEGVRDAITHIGLSTARFTPTAETTAVQNEVLRIAISDSIDNGDNAIQFYAAIAENEWSGNMTAIYTIAFYLSTGTLLAVWSNPNEVEALLRNGRSEEFYYTFALDALPADKIEIISTQRVFNPGVFDFILSTTASTAAMANALINETINSVGLVKAIEQIEVDAINTKQAVIAACDAKIAQLNNDIVALRESILTMNFSLLSSVAVLSKQHLIIEG